MTHLLKTPVKRSETLHMLVHWSLAGWAALLINAWQIINWHKNCPGTFSFPSFFTDYGWTSVLNNYHFTHICLDKDFRINFWKKFQDPGLFAYYQICFHKGRAGYDTMDVNFFHCSLSYLKFSSLKEENCMPKSYYFFSFHISVMVVQCITAIWMFCIYQAQSPPNCFSHGLKKMKRKKQEIFSLNRR